MLLLLKIGKLFCKDVVQIRRRKSFSACIDDQFSVTTKGL